MDGILLPRTELIRLWAEERVAFSESVLADSGLPAPAIGFLAEIGLAVRQNELVSGLGIEIEVNGPTLHRLSEARQVPVAVHQILSGFWRLGSCHTADLCLNPRGQVIRVEILSDKRWGDEDRVLNAGVEPFVNFLYVLERNAERLLAAAETPEFAKFLDAVETELVRIDPSAMTPDGWWPSVLEELRV